MIMPVEDRIIMVECSAAGLDYPDTIRHHFPLYVDGTVRPTIHSKYWKNQHLINEILIDDLIWFNKFNIIFPNFFALFQSDLSKI